MIELEDRFAQQKLIQAGAIPAQPVDPKILAANEEKAEKSYRHKVLNLISGIWKIYNFVNSIKKGQK